MPAAAGRCQQPALLRASKAGCPAQNKSDRSHVQIPEPMVAGTTMRATVQGKAVPQLPLLPCRPRLHRADRGPHQHWQRGHLCVGVRLDYCLLAFAAMVATTAAAVCVWPARRQRATRLPHPACERKSGHNWQLFAAICRRDLYVVKLRNVQRLPGYMGCCAL